MITLYDYELDESCYRVRLVLSMLELDWQTVAVDVVPGAEHLKPAMLALNPCGALPVLDDGGLILTGTGAIMAYLARAYDGGHLLPHDPRTFGQVQMWLEFNTTALAAARDARLASLFGSPGDAGGLAAQARQALRIMDDHITRRQLMDAEWFAGETATLADLALFPGFALSRDFGIGHEEFPGLRRWARRVRRLPGFKTMPGVPNYY